MSITIIITIVASVCIVGYCIKCFRDISGISELNEELDGFREFIEKINQKLSDKKDEVTAENFQEEKLKLFRKMKQSIDDGEECSGFKYLDFAVKEYFEDLAVHNYSGVDPDKYFNEEDLVISNFNINKSASKGSMFVGAGILGTFIGLTWGFYALAHQNSVADQISVIDDMVPSMYLAFFTSIVGMACSIFYTRSEKGRMGAVISDISSLKLKLSRIFPTHEDVAELLKQVNFSLQNLNSGLSKNLGSVVAESIGDNTRDLFGSFSKEVDNLGSNISSRIGRVFNNIFNKEFIEEFKEIHKSLAKMNRTMINSIKGIESLLDGIPKYTQKFEKLNDTTVEIYETSEKIGKTYEKFINKLENIESAIKSIELFKEDVGKMVEFSNASTMKIVEDATNNVAEHYNRLEELSKELHENYRDTGNEIKDILVQSKNITMGMMDNTNIIMRENLDKIEEINKKLSVNMEKICSENQNSNREFLTQLESLKDIIQRNEKLIQDEYDGMKVSQIHLKQSTEDALEAYDKTISHLTEEILNVIGDVKDMRRE